MAKAGAVPEVMRPLAWSGPLRTRNLRAVFPHADFIRVCRASDPFWHTIDYEAIVVMEDKATMLRRDDDVLKFLNANTLFRPQSQAEAEKVLFAFAELRGYQILTKPPRVPDWVSGHEEKQKEADGLDWNISWTSHEKGWKVSCVLVTTHTNLSSSRYEILIRRDGGLEIRKQERHFFTHHIM